MEYTKVITNAQTGEVTVVPMTQAEIDALPPSVIPAVVSMRQARLALLQSGLLSQVNTAITSGSEADKITWEYATEVNRQDTLVQNLAIGLGLSESDLDNLFTLASTL